MSTKPSRSIREIADHVAVYGVAFTNELLAPACNFGNLFKPDVMAAVRASLPQAHTKQEVIDLLRTTGTAGSSPRTCETWMWCPR